jgi:DNA topoisomerase IA
MIFRFSARQAHVCKHLQSEARGADFLVLWLDCDREGENICFEVMDATLGALRPARPGQRQVFRARFSAISSAEMRHAMVRTVCARGKGGCSSALHVGSAGTSSARVHVCIAGSGEGAKL